MDNKTKYDLIVKIKELMLETSIKNIDELLQSEKISINASKVMQLVYSNDYLKSFFEEKLNIYRELREDDKKYSETLEYIDSCIAKIQPYIPFTLRMNFNDIKGFSNVYEYCKNKVLYDNRYNDFVLKLMYADNQFYEKSLKEKIYITHIWGIFSFIEMVIDEYLFQNLDDDTFRLFTTEWITDDYKSKIVETYDYYFLYNAEISYNPIYNTDNIKIYTQIAINKVLDCLLEHLYTVNLSKEQMQEYKKIKMTTTEQTVYNLLIENPNYTDVDLADKLSIAPSTIRTHLQHICEKMNIKNKTELTLKIKNQQK